MWRHLGKPGLWRSKQCFPRSAFSMFIFTDCFSNVQKTRKVFYADAHMWQKDQALIRRSTEGVASDQRLVFFCPSIRQVFPDDVTYQYCLPPLSSYMSLSRDFSPVSRSAVPARGVAMPPGPAVGASPWCWKALVFISCSRILYISCMAHIRSLLSLGYVQQFTSQLFMIYSQLSISRSCGVYFLQVQITRSAI